MAKQATPPAPTQQQQPPTPPPADPALEKTPEQLEAEKAAAAAQAESDARAAALAAQEQARAMGTRAPAPPPARPNLDEPAPRPPGPRAFEMPKSIESFKMAAIEWMQQHDPDLILALLERGERTGNVREQVDAHLAERTATWQSRVRARVSDHGTNEREAMRLAAKDLYPPEEVTVRLSQIRATRLEVLIRLYQSARSSK